MYAVLVPVGPEARDVDRLAALIEELARHEQPDEIRLLIIDDAPRPRTFELGWPEQVVIRTELWRSGARPDVRSAQVAGTLEGIARAHGLEFVVKLDTDAAVIGPFARRLRAAFADPSVGVVGSYDRTSAGTTRNWSAWRRTIDRATLPVALGTAAGSGRTRIWPRSRSNRRAVREIRDAAYRFAPPGAHCLGAAYAVSSRFVASATLDWRPWVRTNLGEDVVVGLLCSHAGLRMQSLTGHNEPFALSWRGLPGSPDELRAAGHSIVHSVKLEDERDERQLRHALQG